MCDHAYVLLLGLLERQVLADRHVAAVLLAAGAKDISLPEFEEKRRLLNAALVEAPQVLSAVDSEQWELRRALGVA